MLCRRPIGSGPVAAVARLLSRLSPTFSRSSQGSLASKTAAPADETRTMASNTAQVADETQKTTEQAKTEAPLLIRTVKIAFADVGPRSRVVATGASHAGALHMPTALPLTPILRLASRITT